MKKKGRHIKEFNFRKLAQGNINIIGIYFLFLEILKGFVICPLTLLPFHTSSYFIRGGKK